MARGQVSFEYLAILVFLLIVAAVVAIQAAGIVSLKDAAVSANKLYLDEALKMLA